MTRADKIRSYPADDAQTARAFGLSPSAVTRIRTRRARRGRPAAPRGGMTIELPGAWDRRVRQLAEKLCITHTAALVLLLERKGTAK